MTYNSLFLGWNRPVAGREKVASELFNSVIGYLTRKQQSGTITSFDPLFLSAHGGDLNGFIVVKSSNKARLDEMKVDEEFLNLVTQCIINIEGFGVIDAITGENVQTQMNRWRGYIGK